MSNNNGFIFSKISTLLLANDEEFLSALKDESKRIEHLNKLYSYRVSLCPKISWSIQVWSNGVVPFRKQFVRM